MSLKRGAIDQNILEEDDNELSEIWSEKRVHGDLEQRGRIAQSKQHYFKLVMAVMCPECGLIYVILLHSYLMVPLQQIKLRKALGTS